jgi:hypothetical protein
VGASYEKNVFFSCVQKHMKERRRRGQHRGEEERHHP